MKKEDVLKKIKELENELENVKGEKCEVYSRVVGYHRPVQNWNDGKQEEFKERYEFGLEYDCCRL
nr:anaerobic ribonucleoside-triphosphate reductase [Deferribacter desulfuricans]